MANGIGAISGVNQQNQTMQTASTQKSNGLSKDFYLKMFIEGLKNQDPMSPMDNSEMMNQMTMMGLMENSTNMATATEKLVGSMNSMTLVGASAFIGKTLDVMGDEGVVTGEVTSVRPTDEGMYLMIKGKGYSLNSIMNIGGDAEKPIEEPKEEPKEDKTQTV